MPECTPIPADDFVFWVVTPTRRIALQVVCFLASISALYSLLAPTISGVPRFRPIWAIGVVCAAAVLFGGAIFLAKRPLGYGLALAGSLCILSLRVCEVLVRLGYFRVEYRLVALSQDIPRWRFEFDKPVFVLLQISTFASLVLSVFLLIAYARVKFHPKIPS